MVFTHMARTFRRYEPDQMLMRRIAAKLQESAAFRFLAPLPSRCSPALQSERPLHRPM